ncbi:MAG: AAA family ATPase [Pirellulales bacterium]|nr:AAA family ATPase [Pirellulales bacterium]
MATIPPTVIVLAGPNGAGKTTAAPSLLRETLEVVEFVNADTIAQGLAAFSPELVALKASAIMLARLKELGFQQRSFAFETTLASRSLAPWLAELIQTGYEFHLVFLWLPSVEFALHRVADRVRMGGHDVPAETVRRRYHAGLRNFFSMYQPLANKWRRYDNSNVNTLRLIASGKGDSVERVDDETIWRQIEKEYAHDK